MSTRSRRVLELLSAEMLTPNVRSLTLRAADAEPIDYVAGQWVNLYVRAPGEAIEQDELLERSYSIACAPDPARRTDIEVAVTLVRDGPMSSVLHALDVGARIEMAGPFGFFTREAAHLADPALFIGTGTGVTPLRAMIVDELRARPEGPPMTLLFGCRTEADLLYRDELTALAARHARFTYSATLSRTESAGDADDAWTGRRGYVQTHLAELVAPGTPMHAYVCGLSRMVQDVRRILKADHAFDRKQIHTERYD